jgi:SAM-dependent methyltransferase
MANRYGEEYFSSVYGVGALKPFSPAWFSARYYAAVARRFLRAIRGRRLLEIGCGQGFVLGFLRDEFETTGVDVSAYALDDAGRNAPHAKLVLASVEQGLPPEIKERKFDLVLAKYVLEHLEHPEAVVRSAFEVLQPGGLFFFSVPNTLSVGKRLKGEAWYAHKDPTHVSLLQPEEWLRIVREAGFSLWTEFGDGYWDLPYFKHVPRWMQAGFFLPPTALMCLLGRPLLPKRFGENILVVARRPG